MIFQTNHNCEVPCERGTFFRQVGKSVISVCKKNKTLSGCEIVEKTFPCGVLISILLLTAVKRDARFYNRYMNGRTIC